MLDKLKVKLEGAKKSLTIKVALICEVLIQNIDNIESLVPQLKTYFGDNLGSILIGVFGSAIVYIRLFHTKGTIEDKVEIK